jgi:hypothetical protein
MEPPSLGFLWLLPELKCFPRFPIYFLEGLFLAFAGLALDFAFGLVRGPGAGGESFASPSSSRGLLREALKKGLGGIAMLTNGVDWMVATGSFTY